MADPRTVAVLVGSLRRESFSRKLAKSLSSSRRRRCNRRSSRSARCRCTTRTATIRATAAGLGRFQQSGARQATACSSSTPEYNRSVPGVLKNAIDVGSRPYGQSVWSRKPGAVVSVSPGAIGAFGANHHLRQSLVFLDVPAMQQPEAYIGGAAALFDAGGKLINDKTRDFLRQFMSAFAAWVEANVKQRLPARTE